MCDHLDRLAGELRRAGWSVTTCYQESPPLLRVSAATVSRVGVGITVGPGPAGVWWFHSSPGRGIVPCADVLGAAWEIAVMLTPRVVAALEPTDGTP